MEHNDLLQDVIRCCHCGDPDRQLHCDYCDVNLCRNCVDKHISNEASKHRFVLFTKRKTTFIHPECSKHGDKICELYCQQCDNPVCTFCVPQEHQGHTFFEIMKMFHIKMSHIKKDMDELTEVLRPLYLEILSEIENEKSRINKDYEKLENITTQEGDKLHEMINLYVSRRLSEIEEMKSQHIHALKTHEANLNYFIHEIGQTIKNLVKMMNSKDICEIADYKSKNNQFRTLPPKISSPGISFQEINLEKQFGFLTPLSYKPREYSCKADRDGAAGPLISDETEDSPATATSSHDSNNILDIPKITATIRTHFKCLYSVRCLNDGKFWTCGGNECIQLYNTKGELLESIETSPGYPSDLALTGNGEVLYTDYLNSTINAVKNTQPQLLIRLRGWRPWGICGSKHGDILVIMDSVNKEPARVVRYSGLKKKQTIQRDDKRQALYTTGEIKHLKENNNLDICVADRRAGALVVVSTVGKFRFRYKGSSSHCLKQPFDPVCVTTDSHGRILTTDYNNHCVHILDMEGQFLRYIENRNLHTPWGLCVDSSDNLFVGEESTVTVKKIQYYR